VKKSITILGAGIAGLSTAIALQNAGIEAMVFEAAPEIKAVGAGLGLGANAIKAFKVLGIDEEVMSKGRVLPSFTVYNQKGKVITKTDSVSLSKKYGLDNFTIHRADLHALLLSKIDPVTIQTNKRLERIVQKGNTIILHFHDGTFHETDHLIAAEGIHSVVRRYVLSECKPRYAGYTCWRAVIDNSKLQLNECSETWGSKGRFGIVPLAGNKIYWFACVNTTANNAAMKNYTVPDLLKQFASYHHPVEAILKETKNENLIWADINDLKPIDRYAFNNILLIGDAAHATTPNLGQGACQAVEDAVILAAEIEKNNNIETAFRKFERRRLKRIHWIVNTSWCIGKIAQLENKFLMRCRDFLFKHIPKKVNEKQFTKIYTTDF
jgi:2-polyprenyl-6-methoxyphenol hydroxylase-like FAD-dependent oxidoreductase